MVDSGERRVIFAEPVELNESDELQSVNSQAEPNDSEEDIGDDMPVKKARKFGQDEMLAAK